MMRKKARGKWNEAGFASIELGPALLLLAALVVAGFRWMALELVMDRRLRESRERAASMEAVQARWRASCGQLALAERDPDGSWRVLDFPGEDWLPMAPADGGHLWRRRLQGAGDSASWQVEYHDRHSGDWEWVAIVLDGAERKAPDAD